MVVDTSVVIAILLQEPEARAFAWTIVTSSPCVMSTATHLESSIVMWRRKGQPGLEALAALVQALGIEVVAFDDAQLRIATRAYVTYGKGYHKASLNFGDCFSYALAKSRNEPLLFKGNDFSQTDIDQVNVDE